MRLRPSRLPAWMRVAGWLLSRVEFVHRGIRDNCRTPLGVALVWANVASWTLCIIVADLPMKILACLLVAFFAFVLLSWLDDYNGED